MLIGGAGGYRIRAGTEPIGTKGTSSVGGANSGGADAANTAGPGTAVVPCYGTNQAGISTRQQEQMMFATFDVITTDPVALQEMLGRWAAVAARFTLGLT